VNTGLSDTTLKLRHVCERGDEGEGGFGGGGGVSGNRQLLTNEGCIAAHAGDSANNKHGHVGCGGQLGGEGQGGDDHEQRVRLQAVHDAGGQGPDAEALALAAQGRRRGGVGRRVNRGRAHYDRGCTCVIMCDAKGEGGEEGCSRQVREVESKMIPPPAGELQPRASNAARGSEGSSMTVANPSFPRNIINTPTTSCRQSSLKPQSQSELTFVAIWWEVNKAG